LSGPLSRTERRAWIALASVDGIGAELFWRLVAEFGGPADVIERAATGEVTRWADTHRYPNNLPLIRPTALVELEQLRSTMDRLLAQIDAAGLWTLTERDPGYPRRLHDLDPAPPVLHGLGDAAVLGAPRITAVVGTRRPTPAGRLLAGQVATRLVEAGAVVVSGVAVGIDGAAHAATIAAGGTTIGVIGGGHHHPGPRAHRDLRRQIVDTGGALISEHHPTIRPTHGTYPRRNRVIAALGDGTVVVEAPRISGALSTAHIALELGRPVLAAPGRIGEWSMAGCLRLLRETPARPLTGLDELIVDLGLDRDAVGADKGRQAVLALSSRAALAMLGGAELSVATRVRQAPAGLDALVDDTGLPPSVVSSAVTLLLLRGWIEAVGPAYLPAGPLLVA
jgi:DNA processing protein